MSSTTLPGATPKTLFTVMQGRVISQSHIKNMPISAADCKHGSKVVYHSSCHYNRKAMCFKQKKQAAEGKYEIKLMTSSKYCTELLSFD